MRRPRSALPLPRYTRRKWLSGKKEWAYFFEVPAVWRAAGCTVASEALGTDYAEAVSRVERVLLPGLDSWRTAGASDAVPDRGARHGTFDWLAEEYTERSRFFRTISASQQRTHRAGLQMVADYRLSDGRRIGEVGLTSLTPAVVDTLYERLLFVTETLTMPDGQVATVVRERRTTVNHAMKSCRRAWFVTRRTHDKIVPERNPFSKMGLKSNSRETPTATYDEMAIAVAAFDKAGLSSIGTAIMVMWEWLQRVEHVFSAFDVDHYRPKDRPDAVRVVHPKTGEESWQPLYEPDGERRPLFPELMERLDEIKRNRIGGLMLVRDWPDKAAGVPLPWPSGGKGGLDYLRHRAKKVMANAGLRPELTLTSFRHGGFTEGADADLTDRELQSIGRHKSVKTLPRYAKRTMKQVSSAQQKRRRIRTDRGQISE